MLSNEFQNLLTFKKKYGRFNERNEHWQVIACWVVNTISTATDKKHNMGDFWPKDLIKIIA